MSANSGNILHEQSTKCYLSLQFVVFKVLWNGMGEPYDPLVNNECLTMLDGLVSRRLAAMLQSISSTETPMEQADKNSLVQKLVNLPDRCANRYLQSVQVIWYALSGKILVKYK